MFFATAVTAFADGFQFLVLLGCLSYVMMFLYLGVFYKKPHENNMKILLLIYAATTAISNSSYSLLVKLSSYAALFGNIVQFAFCSLVYVYRYHAHIEAGLNVPKK